MGAVPIAAPLGYVHVLAGTRVSPGDSVRVATCDNTVIRVVLEAEVPRPGGSTPGMPRRWSFRPDEVDADGRPLWWSRTQSGSVVWPADGDLWADRGTGELGAVRLGSLSRSNVSWTPCSSDGSASRRWMKQERFMDRYAFYERP